MKIEENVKKLEEIAGKLEGEIEIDEAMALFEEGVKIIKSTKKELQDAVGKITVLKAELDSFKEINFDPSQE